MSNLIQIKRSATTAAPTTLEEGELAYTSNGEVLFIGDGAAVIAIGGARNPGILTANQAIVTNSESYVDTIKVANLVATKVSANGTQGTTGQALLANSTGGAYWGTVSGVQVLDDLTDAAVSSASAGQILISNSTGVFRNISLSGDITVDASGVVSIAADSVALGTDTNGNYVATITAGNGLSGNATTEGSTPTIAVVAGSGIVANATGVFVNANNGIVSNSTGVFVNAGTGIVANATGVHIGQAVGTTDNVTFNDVTINGNTLLGSSSADVVAINGAVNTSIMPSTNATYNLGNNTIRWNEVHTANIHSVTGYFDGSVEIAGNLIVTGNVTTTNVNSVTVSDPMIYLAGNNYSSDLVDIGFVGNYNDGATNRHAGLVRHASDDTFYLFKNYTPEPDTNVINIGHESFAKADLATYLLSGGLVSNSTAVTLTANSTVAVNMTANSLSLTTALPGTSGGTGLASYTAEDILVANSSNGFRKLALGTSGYVLQSNGTALVYATLDGGTF